MPMESTAQRAYLWIHHPEIAREFEAATPKGKKLPKHIKRHSAKAAAHGPPHYRPADSQQVSCSTCKFMERASSNCKRYNTPVDPNYVCDSFQLIPLDLNLLAKKAAALTVLTGNAGLTVPGSGESLTAANNPLPTAAPKPPPAPQEQERQRKEQERQQKQQQQQQDQPPPSSHYTREQAHHDWMGGYRAGQIRQQMTQHAKTADAVLPGVAKGALDTPGRAPFGTAKAGGAYAVHKYLQARKEREEAERLTKHALSVPLQTAAAELATEPPTATQLAIKMLARQPPQAQQSGHHDDTPAAVKMGTFNMMGGGGGPATAMPGAASSPNPMPAMSSVAGSSSTMGMAGAGGTPSMAGSMPTSMAGSSSAVGMAGAGDMGGSMAGGMGMTGAGGSPGMAGSMPDKMAQSMQSPQIAQSTSAPPLGTSNMPSVAPAQSSTPGSAALPPLPAPPMASATQKLATSAALGSVDPGTIWATSPLAAAFVTGCINRGMPQAQLESLVKAAAADSLFGDYFAKVAANPSTAADALAAMAQAAGRNVSKVVPPVLEGATGAEGRMGRVLTPLEEEAALKLKGMTPLLSSQAALASKVPIKAPPGYTPFNPPAKKVPALTPEGRPVVPGEPNPQGTAGKPPVVPGQVPGGVRTATNIGGTGVAPRPAGELPVNVPDTAAPSVIEHPHAELTQSVDPAHSIEGQPYAKTPAVQPTVTPAAATPTVVPATPPAAHHPALSVAKGGPPARPTPPPAVPPTEPPIAAPQSTAVPPATPPELTPFNQNPPLKAPGSAGVPAEAMPTIPPEPQPMPKIPPSTEPVVPFEPTKPLPPGTVGRTPVDPSVPPIARRPQRAEELLKSIYKKPLPGQDVGPLERLKVMQSQQGVLGEGAPSGAARRTQQEIAAHTNPGEQMARQQATIPLTVEPAGPPGVSGAAAGAEAATGGAAATGAEAAATTPQRNLFQRAVGGIRDWSPTTYNARRLGTGLMDRLGLPADSGARRGLEMTGNVLDNTLGTAWRLGGEGAYHNMLGAAAGLKPQPNWFNKATGATVGRLMPGLGTPSSLTRAIGYGAATTGLPLVAALANQSMNKGGPSPDDAVLPGRGGLQDAFIDTALYPQRLYQYGTFQRNPVTDFTRTLGQLSTVGQAGVQNIGPLFNRASDFLQTKGTNISVGAENTLNDTRVPEAWSPQRIAQTHDKLDGLFKQTSDMAAQLQDPNLTGVPRGVVQAQLDQAQKDFANEYANYTGQIQHHGAPPVAGFNPGGQPPAAPAAPAAGIPGLSAYNQMTGTDAYNRAQDPQAQAQQAAAGIGLLGGGTAAIGAMGGPNMAATAVAPHALQALQTTATMLDAQYPGLNASDKVKSGQPMVLPPEIQRQGMQQLAEAMAETGQHPDATTLQSLWQHLGDPSVLGGWGQWLLIGGLAIGALGLMHSLFGGEGSGLPGILATLAGGGLAAFAGASAAGAPGKPDFGSLLKPQTYTQAFTPQPQGATMQDVMGHPQLASAFQPGVQWSALPAETKQQLGQAIQQMQPFEANKLFGAITPEQRRVLAQTGGPAAVVGQNQAQIGQAQAQRQGLKPGQKPLEGTLAQDASQLAAKYPALVAAGPSGLTWKPAGIHSATEAQLTAALNDPAMSQGARAELLYTLGQKVNSPKVEALRANPPDWARPEEAKGLDWADIEKLRRVLQQAQQQPAPAQPPQPQ